MPEAQTLADALLHDPVTVSVTPISSTAERIDQSLYFVEKNDKRKLLTDLLADKKMARVLVFSRTKHGANRVVEHLDKARIGSAAIHGNKSQGARERALAGFKNGQIRVLVATDLAARGIDVDDVTHVVNFDLPNIPETYVHRIGRTARAGASGIAISFCEHEERAYLIDIERLVKQHIPRVDKHSAQSDLAPPPITDLAGRGRPPGTPTPPPQGGRGQRDGNQRGQHQRPHARGGTGRPSQGRSAHVPSSHSASRPASAAARPAAVPRGPAFGDPSLMPRSSRRR